VNQQTHKTHLYYESFAIKSYFTILVPWCYCFLTAHIAKHTFKAQTEIKIDWTSSILPKATWKLGTSTFRS